MWQFFFFGHLTCSKSLYPYVTWIYDVGCAQSIPHENFSRLFQPLRHHNMVWYYIVCLKMRDMTGPKVINDHHLNTKLVY